MLACDAQLSSVEIERMCFAAFLAKHWADTLLDIFNGGVGRSRLFVLVEMFTYNYEPIYAKIGRTNKAKKSDTGTTAIN